MHDESSPDPCQETFKQKFNVLNAQALVLKASMLEPLQQSKEPAIVLNPTAPAANWKAAKPLVSSVAYLCAFAC